jgi:hypothetical protein
MPIVHTPLAEPILDKEAFDTFSAATPPPPSSTEGKSSPSGSLGSSEMPPALAAAVARLTYLDPFNSEAPTHSSARRRRRVACPIRGHCGEVDYQHLPLLNSLVAGLGCNITASSTGHTPNGGNLKSLDVRVKSEKDDVEFEEVIAFQKTKFQRSLIYWTPRKGIHFSLDGVSQSVEIDEKIYHEALVHTPMLLFPLEPGPANVVIIGGGEGATVREVCFDLDSEKICMICTSIF